MCAEVNFEQISVLVSTEKKCMLSVSKDTKMHFIESCTLC